MHKKLLAALLAACIMVLMMPSTAFAAEWKSPPWDISVSDEVSEVTADMSLNDIKEGLGFIIKGSGKMRDFDTSNNKSPSFQWSFKYVEISEGITNIGSYIFYDEERAPTFPYIILPSTINEIDSNAFSGRSISVIDLTKLSNNTEIAETAFSNRNIEIIYSPSEELRKKIKNLSLNTAAAVTNGGKFPDNTEYESSELLTPERDGYKFEGWYTNIECTQKAQFTGKGTYYAKWSNTQPPAENTRPTDSPDLQQPDELQDMNPDISKDDDNVVSGNDEAQTDGNTQAPNDPGNSDNDDSPNQGDSEHTTPPSPSTPDTPDETEKLDYDMSGIEFKDGTAVYNGKAQGLTITGTLPKGVEVTYIYENDLVPVTPGEYNIIAKFTGDTEHYNPIPSKMATLTIEKAEMKLSFGYPSLKVLPTDKPFTNDLIGAPKDSIVTYKTSNIKVADVSETGEITIVGEGKTTITASASETPLYKAGTVSYELTVAANKPQEDQDSEDKTLSTITYPNGAKVIVPKDPGRIMTATVVVPDKLDHAVVTIPMEDVAYGTVALNNGTGEIIKLCIPDADGLTVLLEHSMNLIMFDNSKTFKDVPAAYWGKDFINFATAHKLFAGMSETQFSPDIPMTRGMMMTVLASFANVDTKGGSVWYERGMNWAKAMGISDGTYPNNDITREQLAVMLYHYVEDPGISSDSSETLAKKFTDAGKISKYAVTAISWAVENGVMKGMTDTTLDPQGKATRAQVATMMKRICEFIVNENI